MRIIDHTAYDRCHARIASELSHAVSTHMEAAHAVSRGAGGPTCDLNLVLLTRQEHRSHHNGGKPYTRELLNIIGARYGVNGDEVQQELWRVIRLPKGSDCNYGRPSWAPEYIAPADRREPVRRQKNRRRTYRVVTPKVPG